MKKTALIMAGGKGERFWPRSRTNLPKQFLSLTDDGRTMIQLTVDRILPLVDLCDIYIATNAAYRDLVAEQLPRLPKENILCEPIGRNTAPCIGLGAVHIAHKYEDALMIVLASDHLIKYNDIFVQTIEKACRAAEEGKNLVTLGITPNYPETGYGYIKADKTKPYQATYAVDRFVEKPDYPTACSYIESGDYYWNSGMFIWKISSILSNLSAFMPETYNGLITIKSAIGTPEEDTVLKNVFPGFVSDSIDFGVMEKADDIYVIPGNFGWDDVGSWLAVERIRGTDDNGNCFRGKVTAIDTNGCTIEGRDRLIATVGMKDTVIVDTEDAILIADKKAVGDIKKVLAALREQDQNDYL